MSVDLTADASLCVDVVSRVRRNTLSSLWPVGHVVLFSDAPKASCVQEEQSF